MQGNGAKAFLHQVIGQTIALDLRAGENNCLVNSGIAQPMIQQLALVGHVVSPQQRLCNRRVFFMRRINLDTLWLTHDASSQLHDTRRERGAEHHGLLTLNRQLVDFGQVIGKAKVQHTVSFVNHQELNLVEFDLHAALQVKQTARRSHDQISILQLGNLQLVRNATYYVGNAQAAAMANQVNRISANLLGQFTRWAQNQRARRGRLEIAHIGWVFALWLFGRGFATGDSFCAQAFKFSALIALCIFLLLKQGVQHGQQESSGFSTTSLAGNQQVGEFGTFWISIQRLHRFRNSS